MIRFMNNSIRVPYKKSLNVSIQKINKEINK